MSDHHRRDERRARIAASLKQEQERPPVPLPDFRCACGAPARWAISETFTHRFVCDDHLPR